MIKFLASIFKKSVPNDHYYLQRKGILRPDFQPILDLGFFKSKCHHKKQEGDCKEIHA
jgi:hypothetical protein